MSETMKEIMTDQDSFQMTALTSLLNQVLTPDYVQSDQERDLLVKLIDKQISQIQAKYGVVEEK